MKILFTALLCVLGSFLAVAQELTVSGTVTDAKSAEPLSGVLVQISGGGNSTYTNENGEFKLSVKDGYENLEFSLQGYDLAKVFLGGRTSVTVSMIALGSEHTSHPAELSSDDLGTQPVVELEQATQGRAAGMFVQNSGGRLGQGAKVRIRGGSSLTGSNDPLYVVDGVPLTSGNQTDIDPSSIEKMEILKDAAAISLYGSRAANGVILITTKKGKAGKVSADVEYQFGVNQVMKKLDMMSPLEYNEMFIEYNLRNPLLNAGIPSTDITRANLQKWAQASMNSTGVYSINFSNGNNLSIPVLSKLKYNTDWQDQAYRTAYSNRANANIYGGSENQKILVNLNYLNQQGILITNNYERFGGRFNLNSQWSDKLSSNVSMGYVRSDNNKLPDDANDGNPVQMVILPSSDAPNPNDDYNLFVRSSEYNPQTEVYRSTNTQTNDRLNGTASINYSISNNLVFKVDGGLDYLNQQSQRRQGPATQAGAPTGFSRLSTTGVFNYLVNATLNYGLEIGNNSLNVMAGTSYQQSQTTYTYKSARVNSISELEQLPATDPSLVDNPVPGTASKFLSYFTSVGYTIDKKYSFEVDARVDGSSRFSPDKRYGLFPAVSAGWTISNESFLQGNNTVSFLKFHTSYGVVGNTPFNDFLYRQNYFTVQYGNQTGIRQSNMANRQLGWESTAQLDLSLDFGFLKDRITGTINYYNKQTSSLLFPQPVTQISGFQTVIKNNPTLQNQGVEFSISTVNVDGQNFQWQTSFNISANRNKVLDIGGKPFVSGNNAFIEGQPTGVYYMPKYMGVDPLTGKALYDNGKGLPTNDYDAALSSARMVVGNPNPKYYGGMSNNLTYKSFNLNFTFQFVQGIDGYWETGEIIANSGFALYNQTKDQLDRWYQPGDKTDNPVLVSGVENTNPSSRWIVDASYIRLKSLALSYNLPKDMVDRMGLSHFSIYIGGQNLLTFSKYPGYDPDVSYSDPNGGAQAANINKGIDYFSAPQPRIYTTGIKIGF